MCAVGENAIRAPAGSRGTSITLTTKSQIPKGNSFFAADYAASEYILSASRDRVGRLGRLLRNTATEEIPQDDCLVVLFITCAVDQRYFSAFC